VRSIQIDDTTNPPFTLVQRAWLTILFLIPQELLDISTTVSGPQANNCMGAVALVVTAIVIPQLDQSCSYWCTDFVE
jgi:hypothetical protein